MFDSDLKDAYAYLQNEGLLDFLDARGQNTLGPNPIPPDLVDLARLHRLIRIRMAFTVMEFGIGYSTIVISDALAKNELQWTRLNNPPKVRNRFIWQGFAVDTSETWIKAAVARLPNSLRSRVTAVHSSAAIGTFQGQLCHYYNDLPDINPDFIYLDGPDPKDVKGSVHGLSFECDERTVMAGDPLLMESTMLPGAFILVDGRTNNARFLARNFQRRWDHHWYQKEDVTTFELTEERLGPHNILGIDPFGGSKPHSSGPTMSGIAESSFSRPLQASANP